MHDYNFHDLLKPLNEEHQEQLLWFWSLKGKIINWKDIEPIQFRKVPKGIYRPEGKEYVHVKNIIGSEYNPRESLSLLEDVDGGWYFEYPPENNANGMNFFTNKSFRECGESLIPIGFIYQTQNKITHPENPISLYKVCGPALCRYNESLDIFHLYGFNFDGTARILT